MTSIQINFDGHIGNSTTITSQNGLISGVSPFQTNNFILIFIVQLLQTILQLNLIIQPIRNLKLMSSLLH